MFLKSSTSAKPPVKAKQNSNNNSRKKTNVTTSSSSNSTTKGLVTLHKYNKTSKQLISGNGGGTEEESDDIPYDGRNEGGKMDVDEGLMEDGDDDDDDYETTAGLDQFNFIDDYADDDYTHVEEFDACNSDINFYENQTDKFKTNSLKHTSSSNNNNRLQALVSRLDATRHRRDFSASVSNASILNNIIKSKYPPVRTSERLKSWARPDVPEGYIKPDTDDVYVHINSIDYFVQRNNTSTTRRLSGSNIQSTPVIRMFCVTKEGHSVMVKSYGFLPYFYLPIPINDIYKGMEEIVDEHTGDVKRVPIKYDMCDPDDVYLLCKYIKNTMVQYMLGESRSENTQCSRLCNSSKITVDESIVSVDIIDRLKYYGYSPHKYPFFKITVALPSFVPIARNAFEKPPHYYIGPSKVTASYFKTTYESNIAFNHRFTIDKKIQGATWIKLNHFDPTNSGGHGSGGLGYEIESDTSPNRISTCQIELNVDVDSIEHIPLADFERHNVPQLPPLRIHCFDIEVDAKSGAFPVATNPDDKIIQISNCVINYSGEKEFKPIISNVFLVGGCVPDKDADFISVQDERELLEEEANFINCVDPDIITGYNIKGFDLKYIFDRIDEFPGLGKDMMFTSRLRNHVVTAKESNFYSKAFGLRLTYDYSFKGRTVLDYCILVKTKHKLSSYTLNFVSSTFLDEMKDDIDHKQISPLHNGSDEDRSKLARYCMKDSILPVKCALKQLDYLSTVILARIAGGIMISDILDRGQTIRVKNAIFRENNGQYLVYSDNIRKDAPPAEKQYQGATVIEPKCGFYDEPIVTLDFASLYPSIMIAFNICHTTYILSSSISREDCIERVQKLYPHFVAGEDFWISPNNDAFVTEKIRKGILPIILDKLLTERNVVKKKMGAAKAAGDEFLRTVYDQMQLAVKVCANSVYGFTGASTSGLQLIAISASVTSVGRQMIDRTQKVVEETFTIKNGYKYDAQVIYGDTDSVMITFGDIPLREAMEIGKVGANLVSKEFKAPIKLEWEKCYYPYLLMNKKRYAGLKYLDDGKPPVIDCKGIETVRRDNCKMVKNILVLSLDKILKERKPEDAVDAAKELVASIYQNTVDLSQLVITKNLSKTDYAAKQPHTELNKRMKKRGELGYNIGDRIPYIIVKADLTGNGSKTKPGANIKVCDHAEDPIYVMKRKMQVSPNYYLRMLEAPLKRVLGAAMRRKKNISNLSEEEQRQAIEEENKDPFDPSTIFTGDHTRQVNNNMPRYLPGDNLSGVMGGYMKAYRKCHICKSDIKDPNDSNPCHTCLDSVMCTCYSMEEFVEMRDKERVKLAREREEHEMYLERQRKLSIARAKEAEVKQKRRRKMNESKKRKREAMLVKGALASAPSKVTGTIDCFFENDNNKSPASVSLENKEHVDGDETGMLHESESKRRKITDENEHQQQEEKLPIQPLPLVREIIKYSNVTPCNGVGGDEKMEVVDTSGVEYDDEIYKQCIPIKKPRAECTSRGCHAVSLQFIVDYHKKQKLISQRYYRIFDQCRTCQGITSFQPLSDCNAISCPIFFYRETVKDEYEESAEINMYLTSYNAQLDW